MQKEGKKGLSTIVVTLIIILVSLVAVGIIWIVVRNVIQRGSEGIQMGQFTLDAKIKNVNLENASNANNVNLTVKRNPGEGAFTGLKFIFYDGRNSEVITEAVSLQELEEKRFNFHLSVLNVSQLVSISIVPILNVNGKETIGNVLDKYTIRGSEQYQFVCTPATCSGLGYSCGTWLNGTCSGNLNCGNCSGGYSCVSGTCVAGEGTLSQGLVAYYPFNGNANDESGNGNNGIVYGAVLTSDKNGNPNSAYSFDGINDYVEVADDASLKPNSISVSAWFKLNALGNIIILSKSDSSNRQYNLYLEDNTGYRIVFWAAGNNAAKVVSTTIPSIGVWYHAVGTFDTNTNTQKIYINGIEEDNDSTVSNNMPTGTPVLQIGKWTEGTLFFNGIIDEVRIYNRSLTRAEIASLAGITLAQCSDGVDNDLNGCSDYPSDTGCSSASDTTESGGSCVDLTPPVRSNGAPTGTLPAGTTQTTISLNTNEAATCKYSTTPGVAYSSMTNTFSTTGGTSHSRLITGLQNGTSYNYYVRCIDGAGNANTNDYTISFTVGSSGAIYALSCSLTDVQNAINSAQSGDTVRVPAGSCTWDDKADIPTSKKLIFQGAGIGNTIITRTSGTVILEFGQSGSRITGFTFLDGHIIADGDGWRVDHCRFSGNGDDIEGVSVNGNREFDVPEGLVDHCEFVNKRVLIFGWLGLAHGAWALPLDLGTGNNVVYVEDCSFTFTVFGNAIDSNLGGSYVFRHNTVTDVYIEAHSVQGGNRAARRWEIYNNTFITTVARWNSMYLRGGTGVIFNNTLTGPFTWGLVFDNVRDTEDRGYGKCNGSSLWDENTPGEVGWRCRDQIGTGGDDSLWTLANPYPHQSHEPAYIWGNTLNGGAFTVGLGISSSPPHIVLNRDYYVNTAKPGYIPYTYPHPLSLI